jgi:ATP-dependent Clp protease adaptor protein ClpS
VIEFLLLGGVPVGVGALERLRRRQYERAHKAFLATLDDDVQVALHVANHEAKAREQPVSPLHLAYGLVQDESVQQLIGKVGGDVEKLEAAITAALDSEPAGDALHAASAALAYVSLVAAHLERTAPAGDLWARLSRYPAVASAFEAGGLPAHRLLFALVHGGDAPPPRLTAPVPATVHVVLRNDDVTTFEFVRELLHDVFELDDEATRQIAMTTHNEGRAVIGRYPPDVAATRVESARTRAREAGYPLWVGVEPC